MEDIRASTNTSTFLSSPLFTFCVILFYNFDFKDV